MSQLHGIHYFEYNIFYSSILLLMDILGCFSFFAVTNNSVIIPSISLHHQIFSFLPDCSRQPTNASRFLPSRGKNVKKRKKFKDSLSFYTTFQRLSLLLCSSLHFIYLLGGGRTVPLHMDGAQGTSCRSLYSPSPV